MMSIQNTKRKSLKLASQRLLSCIIALTLGSLLFTALGFKVWVYGLFIVLFMPVLVQLKMPEAFMVNAVLVSHLLLQQEISVALMINELVLMLIGLMIGLAANLHMPNLQKEIHAIQDSIEEEFRKILSAMSLALLNQCSLEECLIQVGIDSSHHGSDELYELAEELIAEGSIKSEQYLNNFLTVDNTYYVAYMEMRDRQMQVIKHMGRHFRSFIMTQEEAEIISTFTARLSEQFHECNPAIGLTLELEEILQGFKVRPLPTTREEFEDRSTLLQFLNDLDELLRIKKRFSSKYSMEGKCKL